MLAVLAGSGVLPAVLVQSQSERPYVCALDGFLPDGVTPDRVFRLETLGTVLNELKARGVTDVCFAGAIRRPAIDPAQIDAATLPLVPVIMNALGDGDDGALKAVIAVFEHAGFTVRGAHEIAPDLLPPAGVLTQTAPTEADERDADRATAIIAAMSGADIGQSSVVQAGQALALEGVFGTDWMLNSLQNRPDDGVGGVFFKAPKADQDRRADLPTIGVETVTGVARAGLRGLIIEVGGVMVLDREQVIAACDAQGLFLWVRAPEAT